MQTSFDRANARIHRARDLFHRKFLVVSKNQDFALQRRQSSNSNAHRLGEIDQVSRIDRQGNKLLIFRRIPSVLPPPELQNEIACDPQQE